MSEYYDFELDDFQKITPMRINCSYCRKHPVRVCALVFHDQMTTRRDSDVEGDVIGIFCQGADDCDGAAWAFEVQPDNPLVQKKDSEDTLTTNN